MKSSSLIKSTLALVTLTACSVRSRAPENEGIGNLFDDAGAPGTTAQDAGNVPDTDVSDTTTADSAALVDAEVHTADAYADAHADAGDFRDEDTADAQAPGANIPRARGFYVFSLDYNNSLSIGAVGVDGTILSKSLLSAGSELPGLSLPLGTDAVPANQVQAGDELVVIDRTNHAVDWLDLSAEVTNQVGVGPGGFAANPYDYLQLSSELGFVSRFATNGAAGNAPYDEGGDLLAVNPETKELLGRVDFSHLVDEVADLQPRPTKMIAYDGKVYVVLGMLGADFTPLADSVLAEVDPATLEVTATLGLGLTNCEDISMAPQGGLVAIGCKGGWADDPITVNSGIVLVDLTQTQPALATTYGAAELAEAQISTLSFASETLILFSSYGSNYTTPIVPDRAFTLDLRGGTVSEPVMEAGAYQLGHIRCAAEQNVCVLANADTFAVEFFEVEADGVAHQQTVEFDADLGLPPRYIGVF